MRTKRTTKFTVLDITAGNVDRQGFFCYMSKKKSEGYQRKLNWLKNRFNEDLRIKMLVLPERGFIEYMPGEYAWRAVHASGYMFIHCLWIVGQSKGKGLGSALLELCISDAKAAGMKGVVTVTSEKNWLLGREILEKKGFMCVDTAPPAFSLMVKNFQGHEYPSFAGDWEKKASSFGKGLTIIRSDQCPYIVDATKIALAAAEKAGIDSRVVEILTHKDLLKISPTPYGVFSLVLNGKLLSYHYLLENDILKMISAE